MTFQLLKKFFTEILVKPVLNGVMARYAPRNENQNPIILASLIVFFITVTGEDRY